MGCFSFKCQKCGKGINSSSFEGEHAHLFLLRKGVVIQQMTGEYDSYGRVFIDGSQRSDVNHSLRDSEKWNDPFPEKPLDAEKVKIIGKDHAIWHRVCDLMHDNEDFSNGIAAFHVKCYDGVLPTTRSENDPDQGWGKIRKGKPKPIPGYNHIANMKKRIIEEKLWRVENDLEFEKKYMMIDDGKFSDFAKMRIERYENQIKQYKEELSNLEE